MLTICKRIVFTRCVSEFIMLSLGVTFEFVVGVWMFIYLYIYSTNQRQLSIIHIYFHWILFFTFLKRFILLAFQHFKRARHRNIQINWSHYGIKQITFLKLNVTTRAQEKERTRQTSHESRVCSKQANASHFHFDSFLSTFSLFSTNFFINWWRSFVFNVNIHAYKIFYLIP